MGGIAARAGGNWSSVSSACFHLRSTFFNQPKRVSPRKECLRLRLTTWLQPIVCSLPFSPIRWWQDIMTHDHSLMGIRDSLGSKRCIGKGYESQFINGYGLNLFNVVPANILASWGILLASINVLTFAQLIWDCNIPKRLQRSGLLFVAAYCSDPIAALSDCFSVTVASGTALLSGDTVMAEMSFTYCSWWTHCFFAPVNS